MKHTLIIPILALSVIITAFGCTKTASKTTSGHYVTVTTSGGGSFTTTDTTAKAWRDATYLGIEGKSTSGALISLGIISAATAGTWHFPYPAESATGYYISATSSFVTAAHGSITLTSVSPDLVGTFHFTGIDSAVYSGSFNVLAP